LTSTQHIYMQSIKIYGDIYETRNITAYRCIRNDGRFESSISETWRTPAIKSTSVFFHFSLFESLQIESPVANRNLTHISFHLLSFFLIRSSQYKYYKNRFVLFSYCLFLSFFHLIFFESDLPGSIRIELKQKYGTWISRNGKNDAIL